MHVLDTNVISEMLRPRPNPSVRAWLARLERRRQAVAATTAAELLAGVATMPRGRRRDRLSHLIEDALAGIAILPFDERAAHHYAQITATRRAAGRPISTVDAQVAATARAYGAAVATRDTGSFTGCGVDLINPWTD